MVWAFALTPRQTEEDGVVPEVKPSPINPLFRWPLEQTTTDLLRSLFGENIVLILRDSPFVHSTRVRRASSAHARAAEFGSNFDELADNGIKLIAPIRAIVLVNVKRGVAVDVLVVDVIEDVLFMHLLFLIFLYHLLDPLHRLLVARGLDVFAGGGIATLSRCSSRDILGSEPTFVDKVAVVGRVDALLLVVAGKELGL